MTDIINSHNLEQMKNPFYDKLYPNCLEREAGFNRGCYSGFEEARNVFEPKIEEARRQERERIAKQLDNHFAGRWLSDKMVVGRVREYIEQALGGE